MEQKDRILPAVPARSTASKGKYQPIRRFSRGTYISFSSLTVSGVCREPEFEYAGVRGQDRVDVRIENRFCKELIWQLGNKGLSGSTWLNSWCSST